MCWVVDVDWEGYWQFRQESRHRPADSDLRQRPWPFRYPTFAPGVPQRWTGAAIEARVLLLPTGDPTMRRYQRSACRRSPAPRGSIAREVLPGLDTLLGPDPHNSPARSCSPVRSQPPANARCAVRRDRRPFPIAPRPRRRARRARPLAGTTIRKQLPASYTARSPSSGRDPARASATEFGCSLRDTLPAKDTDPKPPTTVTWGAVLSFALRQPRSRARWGYCYDVTIPIASPDVARGGGWLYVELDPASPIVPPLPDTVRRYAARLPTLAAGAAATRPLFGAVLFPVGLTAAGDYGQALSEAAIYDDGFGKIVHAAQAVTVDAASGSHDMLPPATDAGIDLGWDDEQVTLWLNRQLDALRKRLDPLQNAVEAPLGVSGYRVDVRMPDDPLHDTVGVPVSGILDRCNGGEGAAVVSACACGRRIHR